MNFNDVRKNENKGFSLVELIVTIAIMAVMVTVLAPALLQYVEKSRIGVDESYISEVAHNLEIIGATDPDVNGTAVKVTFTAAGALTADVADVDTELDALFTEQKFVSKHYKTDGNGASVEIELDTDGAVTISGTKNING